MFEKLFAAPSNFRCALRTFHVHPEDNKPKFIRVVQS